MFFQRLFFIHITFQFLLFYWTPPFMLWSSPLLENRTSLNSILHSIIFYLVNFLPITLKVLMNLIFFIQYLLYYLTPINPTSLYPFALLVLFIHSNSIHFTTRCYLLVVINSCLINILQIFKYIYMY